MPPIELSAEDRASMTPDEIEALTGDGAEAALGNVQAAADTVESDSTVDEPAAADPQAAETKPATGDAPADDALSAEELAAILADGEQPAPKPQALPTYEVDATDFSKQRADLKTERKAVEAKWSAGELSDEERITALETINDQIEAITRAEATAETIRTINEQNQRTVQAQREANMNSAVTALIQRAKGQIDYVADAGAAKMFDTMLTALESDPGNAGNTEAELVQKTHEAMLALRGIAAAPAAAPEPTAKAQPEPRKIPPTLSGLPAAADNDAGQDIIAQFSRLEGDDAEAFLARMSPEQVRQITRQADGNFAGRSH